MGGLGSGNKSRISNTMTTEEYKRIDIRFLKSLGVLGKYRSGILSWSCNGSQTGFINYSISPSQLNLDYRFRASGEDWQPVKQQIDLIQTNCNYGGSRMWFACPKCNRRCGVLYAGGPLFLCRKCYRIPYTSQTKGPIDRLIHKLHKLDDRLFDETGYRKRKGMHWSTFDRLINIRDDLEGRIDQLIYGLHLEGIPRGGYTK
ncbi:MAG: hypothetical protein D9N13_06100 [Ketobacter sp. GenoA1]|nr:MAG: hypothetical protein D9N13_06100 [Ketobacter sp. GenoA1]RLT99430.1 MAG: hypothetical protein D9N15_00035 [Ketobacter sp.]